jgi:acylglycerol lipase
MGGEIAVLTAMRRQEFFRGVVLSAPAIEPDPALATPLRVAAARVFGRIAPSLPVGAIEPAYISRDPEQVAAYVNDPLCWHESIKARWGYEALQGLQAIADGTAGVVFPFLIMQGSADKIVFAPGAQKFHDGAKSTDKTLISYEGFFHDLLNEPKHDADVRVMFVQRVCTRLADASRLCVCVCVCLCAQRVLSDVLAWITPRIG